MFGAKWLMFNDSDQKNKESFPPIMELQTRSNEFPWQPLRTSPWQLNLAIRQWYDHPLKYAEMGESYHRPIARVHIRLLWRHNIRYLVELYQVATVPFNRRIFLYPWKLWSWKFKFFLKKLMAVIHSENFWFSKKHVKNH